MSSSNVPHSRSYLDLDLEHDLDLDHLEVGVIQLRSFGWAVYNSVPTLGRVCLTSFATPCVLVTYLPVVASFRS